MGSSHIPKFIASHPIAATVGTLVGGLLGGGVTGIIVGSKNACGDDCVVRWSAVEAIGTWFGVLVTVGAVIAAIATFRGDEKARRSNRDSERDSRTLEAIEAIRRATFALSSNLTTARRTRADPASTVREWENEASLHKPKVQSNEALVLIGEAQVVAGWYRQRRQEVAEAYPSTQDEDTGEITVADEKWMRDALLVMNLELYFQEFQNGLADWAPGRAIPTTANPRDELSKPFAPGV